MIDAAGNAQPTSLSRCMVSWSEQPIFSFLCYTDVRQDSNSTATLLSSLHVLLSLSSTDSTISPVPLHGNVDQPPPHLDSCSTPPPPLWWNYSFHIPTLIGSQSTPRLRGGGSVALQCNCSTLDGFRTESLHSLQHSPNKNHPPHRIDIFLPQVPMLHL